MFKTLAQLEVKVGEKLYKVICENDSPLEDVINFLKFALDGCEKMLEDTKKKMEDEATKASPEQPIEPSAIEQAVQE